MTQEEIIIAVVAAGLVGYLLGRKGASCTCQGGQAAQQAADPLAWLNSWTG